MQLNTRLAPTSPESFDTLHDYLWANTQAERETKQTTFKGELLNTMAKAHKLARQLTWIRGRMVASWEEAGNLLNNFENCVIHSGHILQARVDIYVSCCQREAICKLRVGVSRTSSFRTHERLAWQIGNCNSIVAFANFLAFCSARGINLKMRCMILWATSLIGIVLIEVS